MKSRKLAKKIISSLMDRSGFDGWYGSIDEDIQDEIIDEIANIINTNTNHSEPVKNDKQNS